jgi:hypothetical protein
VEKEELPVFPQVGPVKALGLSSFDDKTAHKVRAYSGESLLGLEAISEVRSSLRSLTFDDADKEAVDLYELPELKVP